MNTDQQLLIALLITAIALFMWGRWRHDLVASATLLCCILAGLVPAEQAFDGLGHPAVITVAFVLVFSKALQDTGLIDNVAHRLIGRVRRPVSATLSLTFLGAMMSSFMNNIGAMALLMPIAMQFAVRAEIPPGRILMPLAFGTILGGMTTLIGTPPNLIVSGFREQTGHGSFAMFDFTPVGICVAIAGVTFIGLIGWRLVPKRERNEAVGFDSGTYLTEASVTSTSKAIGLTVSKLTKQLNPIDAKLRGMVRQGQLIRNPNARIKIAVDDILVIEAEPTSLATVLAAMGLTITHGHITENESQSLNQQSETETDTAENNDNGNESIELLELAVMPTSSLIGRSASGLKLKQTHGLNLLAISRQGHRAANRLHNTRIKAGDVLLLQAPTDIINEFASEHGCVPLANREIRIPHPGKATLTGIVMLLVISAAAFGLLPAAIAFATGALVLIVSNVLSSDDAYHAVDWPIIILLAALIPVAGAIDSTGAASLIANTLLSNIGDGGVVIALTLLLIITMTLSDFMNNAATAAMMCPIAIRIAEQLGASSDAFLMAVAIGASCAFLTPIGHQSNTLIMGPGGFRFGDYWRLGLPMEIIVVVVSVPMLLLVWA